MKKLVLFIFTIIISLNIFATESSSSSTPSDGTGNTEESIPIEEIIPPPDGIKPEIGESIDIDDITGYTRKMIKTYTVKMNAKVDIRIPLEIMTDVDLDIEVIGNERKVGKFDIELTRKPNTGSKYNIIYTNPDNPNLGGENDVFIDVDGDGSIDTYIASKPIDSNNVKEQGTKFIFPENEYVVIGDNIILKSDGASNTSKFKKTIYMTVEMGAGL